MRKAVILAFTAVAAAGCNTDMWRQPKQEPLDASDFYADGMADRPLVPGTIARDHLREDDAYYTGIKSGKWVDQLPMPLTMDLLKRGQDRFNIYCTPCHGRLGDGQGMIAHRGFQLVRPVGDYHTARLRNMPIGHFYDVMTNGYGAMFSYAARIEPQDRWAIAAYIRVLQLSQHASPDDADPAALTAGSPAESTSPIAAPIGTPPPTVAPPAAKPNVPDVRTNGAATPDSPPKTPASADTGKPNSPNLAKPGATPAGGTPPVGSSAGGQP